MQDINKSRVDRQANGNMRDSFQGSSHLLYVLVFTTWRIFTISTKDTIFNPLHKRGH